MLYSIDDTTIGAVTTYLRLALFQGRGAELRGSKTRIPAWDLTGAESGARPGARARGGGWWVVGSERARAAERRAEEEGGRSPSIGSVTCVCN